MYFLQYIYEVQLIFLVLYLKHSYSSLIVLTQCYVEAQVCKCMNVFHAALRNQYLRHFLLKL